MTSGNTAAIGAISPFAGLNVPWLLRTQAEQRGDHPFVTWAPFDGADEKISYRQFHDRVTRFAAGLANKGVTAGDSVLIHLDNCPEFLVAWFACAEIGALAVTTNARAAPAEMTYFAEHTGARAAITQPSFAQMVASSCPALEWIAVTAHNAGVPDDETARPAIAVGFDAIFADRALLSTRTQDPFESCSVQFTSGTTGRPKAVVWSHGNALWGGKVNAAHQGLMRDDVIFIYLPLFHTNAISYSMLAALWAGASIVLTPRFSASRFWPMAIRYRCTVSSMIYFSMRVLRMHDVPEGHSFRLWGTPVSDPDQFADFGIKMVGWWGMTETITHGIVGDLHQAVRPLGIGRAACEYDIRVTGEDGEAVEVGETGNLLIRGTPGISLFKEYLHNARATRESFDEDGYFITGDRVDVLENGVLRFSERAKNVMRVGGENVSASEIERVALGVTGVREAAAVRRADPVLGDVPVLFVIADPVNGDTAGGLVESVLATCRENLADFKVPRDVIVVDDFPRATLGKVAKNQLEKMLEPAQ